MPGRDDVPGLQPFGALLRRFRVAAGLSQEQLAERAGLSADAVGALERGARRAPYRHTVRALAQALALAPADAAALEGAVGRGRHPTPAADRPRRPPSLPAAPTPLVGRDREAREVADLLPRPEARLLTLTGPGGVGKTRLALAAAEEVAPRFPDGVAFVALAALRDPGLVAPTVARALGVREGSDGAVAPALVAYLRARELLLVLDNFEHLAPAALFVAELLAACPGLRVLATSRAVLRVRGERVYPVSPLPAPDPARLPPLDALARVPAVDLLVQRARDTAPDFALGAANAADVAALCHRLDGLPLALELAAARLTVLSPGLLLRRLGRRLPLLTGGARDLPARQQTLRATLAWSYELLSTSEQALFRRLAVFAGGWTLDAAEMICAVDDDAPGDVLDGLCALADKSLVRREDIEGGTDAAGVTDAEGTRFSMLETVREYGLELLEEGGEADEARRRHAAHYLALGEAAERGIVGPGQVAWLARLEREHDNLRAALHWARARGNLETGARLAAALERFWLLHGYPSEGRAWLQGIMAAADDTDADGTGAPLSAAARARALAALAHLASDQGDFDQADEWAAQSLALHHTLGDAWGMARALEARGGVALRRGAYARAKTLFEESLALYRGAADDSGGATVLNNLGGVAYRQGDLEGAVRLYEDALALYQGIGSPGGIALALGNLALMAIHQRDYARAAEYGERSLALYRQLGHKRGMASALNVLGYVAIDQGQTNLAAARHEESLALYRELGNRWSIATTLGNLGAVAKRRGEYERAAALYRESLALHRDLGDEAGAAGNLEGLAGVVCAQGQPALAVRLCAAAGAWRERLGAPLPPVDQDYVDETVAQARATLGDAACADAWAAGRALTPDQASAAALDTATAMAVAASG